MTEDQALRENFDVLRVIENIPPSGEIPVPERQLFVLERVRGEALTAMSPMAVSRPLKIGITWPVFRRRLLRAAAAIFVLAGLAWYFLPRLTSPSPARQSVQVARVVITSPGDIISTTRPRIAWTSKDAPDQRYDVWILPAEGDHVTAPAMFVAKNVTSPVEFSVLEPSTGIASEDLQPGTNYRVLVCLASAGRMAGVPVPFKTSPVAK